VRRDQNVIASEAKQSRFLKARLLRPFGPRNDERKLIALVLFSLILVSSAGCGRKIQLIRKNKKVTVTQPILVLQPNDKAMAAPAVRYQEHFAYWKSWHSELMGSFGEMRKRDLRNLNGVISELRAMEDILTGPPADHLRSVLQEISGMEDKWQQEPETWTPPSMMRSRLEQLMREIDRSFYYKKVKTWIPQGKVVEPLPSGKS